ncbi:MAG: hypothetical protein KDD06_22890, partial [Phaeodactylibacter sp.]|nr:hypothetical protein [Phaeodactylibacter sp.]
MLKKPFVLSAALFLLAVLSCRQEDDIPPPDDNGPKEVPVGNLLSAPITIEMDPNGLTPLAGIARISTLERTEVEMQIPGEYPVQVASKPGALSHEMLVLGLYPGRENEIIFKISNTDNSYYGYDTLTVEAPPLPDFLPEIEI